MKKVAIIACSHNLESKSTKLAWLAKQEIKEAKLFSLKELQLPFCDGGSVYELPQIKGLISELSTYDAFLFAVPIYNFSVNAAAKNFIELFGECLAEKTVGVICSAGGVRGYMSVVSFMNSMALDFRCRIIPKFVFATAEDWIDKERVSSEIEKRVKEVSAEIQLP